MFTRTAGGSWDDLVRQRESERNPKTAGQEENMTVGTREQVKNQKVHWTTKLENGGKKRGIESVCVCAQPLRGDLCFLTCLLRADGV